MLSAEGQAIPLSNGYSTRELARAIGISCACVEDALDELKAELLTLTTRERVLEQLDRLALPR
jgi:hypothetical protein